MLPEVIFILSEGALSLSVLTDCRHFFAAIFELDNGTTDLDGRFHTQLGIVIVMVRSATFAWLNCSLRSS